MTIQETEQTMREIFVVDGNLDIYPAQVQEKDWEKGGTFSAKTKQVPVPIIVQRGGWNRLTTYAGFDKREKAAEFKAIIEAKERGGTPQDISERLQKNGLAKCTECEYENKAGQFGWRDPKCPICGARNIVYA